ncbi:MAG: signal peptidase II [Phycisphaerales bacterium]
MPEKDRTIIAAENDPQMPALRRPRAWRSPSAWMLLLFVFAGGLALDLGSKSWAFNNVANFPVNIPRDLMLADPNYNPVPYHTPRHVVPGVLDFRLVVNRGAVFGIGQNRRPFFIAFTVVAIFIGVLLFARWTAVHHRLAHLAIGLILAGGVGNLWDRFQYVAVRDFLHLFPDLHLPFNVHWPGGNPEVFPWVFNIADMMLLAGMVLLMFHINRAEARRKKIEVDPPDAELEESAA